MEFILKFITWENLSWVFLGIPALFGLMIFIRLLRSGRKSFKQRHDEINAKIFKTTQEVDELNKSIRKNEQLHIITTALHQALEIHGHKNESKPLISIEKSSDHIKLLLEDSIYIITYYEKRQNLQSVQRTMLGHGYFEVKQRLTKQDHEKKEIFYDLFTLEQYLLQKLTQIDQQSLPVALRKR